MFEQRFRLYTSWTVFITVEILTKRPESIFSRRFN